MRKLLPPGRPAPVRATGPFRTHGEARAGGRDEAGEAGQIMVLLIGYVLLTLLLVTVVAAAGSLYVGHKKLFSLADGAALAAADTFELNGAEGAADPGTRLDSGAVRAAAQEYLAGQPIPEGLDAIALASASGAGDGRTAEVSLGAVVHPLFINFLVPDGISISVTSTARAKLLL